MESRQPLQKNLQQPSAEGVLGRQIRSRRLQHIPSTATNSQSIKTIQPTKTCITDAVDTQVLKDYKDLTHTQDHTSQTQERPTSPVTLTPPYGPTSVHGQLLTPGVKRRPHYLPIGTNSTQAKVSRLFVVKPAFDVIYADLLVRLNGANYLLYGVDDIEKPVIRVQDCVYNKQASSTSGENYVPRSVKFTPRQWCDLLAVAEDITAVLESDPDSIADGRVHIGGNTFVTVRSDRGTVDIREFFLPKDRARPTAGNDPESFYDLVIPTRRGVHLSTEGWVMLITKGAQMMRELADDKILTDTQPCYLSHPDPVADVRKCHHCNPNGYIYC